MPLNDDENQLESHTLNRSMDRSHYLREYAQSRIRPVNRGNENTDRASYDILQMPASQRDELIEEVADSLRKILAPVSVCLLSVIVVISCISFYSRNDGVYLIYTPFHEDGPISSANKFGYAVANSFIIIGVVVAMTLLLVALYYFRCYKLIHGWLIFVSLLVLFLFSGSFLVQIIDTANLSLDYITYAIILYNFGIMGLLSIHWKSPLKLQQFYLISTSLLMSLTFIKYLPEWTSWVFLVFLATYDIIAVLCPGGPLKLLLKIVQERNEPLMPALIYSSMAWILASFSGETRAYKDTGNEDEMARLTENESANNVQQNSSLLTQDNESFSTTEAQSRMSTGSLLHQSVDHNDENVTPDETNYEVASVKLGLGDFIFYSVLIGKAAASNDWNTVYACTLGILAGLCSTLTLLAVTKHALPALPISVALGVLFYFTTYYAVTPMMNDFSKNMIFL